MKTSAAHSLETPMSADAQGTYRDREPSLAQSGMSLIRDVPVRITARLGSATLTIERLFSLKSGDIVELDQQLDDVITFYMGDKPIARGSLVAVGDHYGIELAEIL